MKFVNLEQHSYYSMPQGILSLEEIDKFYKKHNMEYVLTDIHSTASNLERLTFLETDDKYVYGSKVKIYPDLLLKKIKENLENKEILESLINEHNLNELRDADDLVESFLVLEKELQKEYYFINVYPKNIEEYTLLNKKISSSSVLPLSELSGFTLGVSNGQKSIVDYYYKKESNIFINFLKNENKFIILNIQGDYSKLSDKYIFLKKNIKDVRVTFSFNAFLLNKEQELTQKILVDSWAKEEYKEYFSFYPSMNFTEKLKEIYSIDKNYTTDLIKNSILIYESLSLRKEAIKIKYPEIANSSHFIVNENETFINPALIKELQDEKKWNLNNEHLLKNIDLWDCDFLSFSQKEKYEDILFDDDLNKRHCKDISAINMSYVKDVKNKINNKFDNYLEGQEYKKEILFKLFIYHNKIDLSNEKYFNRIMKELDDISYNGTINLIDYFLHLESIIRKAKKTGNIFNFGRGSSVASLICYALDITDCDPILYNLKFERFMSKDRTGFLDFSVADYSFEEFNKKSKISI